MSETGDIVRDALHITFGSGEATESAPELSGPQVVSSDFTTDGLLDVNDVNAVLGQVNQDDPHDSMGLINDLDEFLFENSSRNRIFREGIRGLSWTCRGVQCSQPRAQRTMVHRV